MQSMHAHPGPFVVSQLYLHVHTLRRYRRPSHRRHIGRERSPGNKFEMRACVCTSYFYYALTLMHPAYLPYMHMPTILRSLWEAPYRFDTRVFM